MRLQETDDPGSNGSSGRQIGGPNGDTMRKLLTAAVLATSALLLPGTLAGAVVARCNPVDIGVDGDPVANGVQIRGDDGRTYQCLNGLWVEV